MINSVEDAAAHLFSEPLLGFIGRDLLEFADTAGAATAFGNTLADLAEDNVEIHTENTCVGIVLDAQVNVLINTKTEVAYDTL